MNSIYNNGLLKASFSEHFSLTLRIIKFKAMKNSVSGIITAFLAGAAVGALFGVLYAPEKGSETRSKLKNIGDELGEEFADHFESIKKEFTGEDKKAGRKSTKSSRGRKPGTNKK